MDVGNDQPPAAAALESREPALEDLVDLCRQLNAQGAEYIIVGGFAMRAAGYIRRTMDIDLLIATGPENEARVFRALESLPDRAVRELQPGEVERWALVRVADEIVVDLLRAAGDVEYREAASDVAVRRIDGVAIPFASPRLLWRTKRSSLRDKDKPDLHFLRLLFQQAGERPPE